MNTKRLVVSSLVVLGAVFSTACVGKFQKGKFENMIFEKSDKNSDGSLDKKEHLNLALKRFEMIDDNEDGKVTKKELKQCRFSNIVPNFVDGYFKVYDQNSDSKVTKIEIINQTKKEFIKLDKNSDGAISKGEFKKQKRIFEK